MEIEALYELVKTQGFSTDTRTVRGGNVFIALKGDNFDANELAAEALTKGAAYAIIDNPAYKTDDRYILVDNTLQALQHLATMHRKHFSIPVLVIGGSNGKTTTKELINAVLSKKYKTHATTGNLNNDIGVPLTILAMPHDCEIAVIEIGANHQGEHTQLLNIVSPTHVLVTNNGADHLEGFGSLEGVRSANKEIYDWARTHNAHVLVHRDIVDLVEDSDSIDRTLYPTKPYSGTSSLCASVKYDNIEYTTSLFGSYNEPNILAAIALGEHFAVRVPDIQDAISEYTPTLKRSQILNHGNYSVILDCYNANPSSMELALRDFARGTSSGNRVFIIGDMLEMGKEEYRVHLEILTLLRTLADPTDIVWCVGPRFGMYKNEFPFTFYEDTTYSNEMFKTLDLSGKTVFLKASRGIKLENVIM